MKNRLPKQRKLSRRRATNFTWSHSIDLANPGLGNPFDLNWKRGNTNIDMPWNFSSALTPLIQFSGRIAF